VVEARVRLVLGGDAGGARFQEGRDADAAKLAVALRLLAALRKTFPVGSSRALSITASNSPES